MARQNIFIDSLPTCLPDISDIFLRIFLSYLFIKRSRAPTGSEANTPHTDG